VLDLADDLELTPAQLGATEVLYATMHKDAISVGEQLLAAEFTLDRAFAQGSVGEQSLHDSLLKIGALRAQLRFVHLVAHLQQQRLLTERQIQLYDTIRGYNDAAH
jgi:hypothetical protein